MSVDSTSPLSDVHDLIRNQPVVNLPRAYNDDGSVRMSKFGRLERLGEWMAACQRTEQPKLENATLALFAGAHGLAQHGVSVSPDNATQRRIEGLREGKSVTNGLAAQSNATLRIFELALELPTKDISKESAMTEQECASTIAFGMEAVTDSPDCLALGVLGVGGGTAAAAVACALYGGDAQYWVRAGHGIAEEINQARANVLNSAVELHRGHMSNPLEALQRLGGRELAACVGAIIAARHQGIPVVLDSFATAVAAGVIHAIDPRGIDHVIAGHQTDRPAHKAILERLDLEPLLDLQLQLGEGVGGLLALPLLRAACTISGPPGPQKA